jgi:hypothetical protein
MCLRCRQPFALGVMAAVALAAAVAAQQSSGRPSAPALAGLFRSELSLGGYTATVASVPAAADALVRRQTASAGGEAAPSRVRVAQLETNTSLRLGDVAVGKRDPAGSRYDLWLEAPGAATSAWSLQIAAAGQAAGEPSVVGSVPLGAVGTGGGSASSSDRNSGAVPGFVAALVPDTERTGRLVLRWGSSEAVVGVAFTDPPQTRRTSETTPPNTTVNRAHDEDTSVLSRARMLAQRNETAFVLPSGQRFSVSFQRTFGKGERASAGGAARPDGLAADGPDFARLASTPDGAVVLLTRAAVPRLAIDRPLRFGRTEIATGNLVRGFPGSYGMWLKRSGRGWRLVFNHEPDAWGSQHDPKFDAAEIELTHSDGHAPTRPFAVGLVPTSPERGRLVILWGPHEWTADFVVGG